MMTEFQKNETSPADDLLILGEELLSENDGEEKGAFSAEGDVIGQRLDAAAAAETGMSRSAVQQLIAGGSLTVNGRSENKNYKLRGGDLVEYILPPPEASDILPENIPLSIVYEDADIIVINKPTGMVVHPAPGNPSGTLVNALLYHCMLPDGTSTLSGIGGVIRPGIVHRIDKETSGLLAVAKNDAAHIALSDQLKDHAMSRVYFAFAIGQPKEDAGDIDAPIGRHPVDRKKMAVLRGESAGAREAQTHFDVLERYPGFSYLRLQLKTGRTHQIRVHMSSLGHPLMGDTLYGGGRTPFEKKHAPYIHGQCLHAGELTLTHPTTGERMTFTAPPEADFEKIHTLLRQL